MSPQSGRWLGLDIGGTTVKAGVVEPDGSWERSPEVLPTELAGGPPLPGIERFCEAVLDAVSDVAPCTKIQSACFERHGAEGVAAAAAPTPRHRGIGRAHV